MTIDPAAPATVRSVGYSRPVCVGGSWKPGTKAGRYFVVLNAGEERRELASFDVAAGLGGTFAVRLRLAAGTYELSAGAGGIGVYAGRFSAGDRGGWSTSRPNA